MPIYDLTLIFKPDLKETEQKKIVESLKKVIEDKKGKVVSANLWGRKPLAYEIKKQKEGIYYLISFAGEAKIVSEFDKKIKLEQNILRHLIVRTD